MHYIFLQLGILCLWHGQFRRFKLDGQLSGSFVLESNHFRSREKEIPGYIFKKLSIYVMRI